MKFNQMIKNFFKSVGVRAALITTIGAIIVAGMYILNSRSNLVRDNIKYIKEIQGKNVRIDFPLPKLVFLPQLFRIHFHP